MDADVLTGDFGPYRIERILGQGGMATVYLARHEKLGQVALKVLHKHLFKKPEILHRFWREMRLSDRIDHPRIVRVRDAGVEGERFYLAMDFIDGCSLFDFERKHRRLDAPTAIRIMSEILEGIEHAHEAGLVHRDLKPENVLLDAQGRAHVSDFGIAKHLEGTKLTQTGVAVGTPFYMAPEQIRNAKTVGPAADIYSAGILLYEMVTGAVPYNADDPMEVAREHIHGIPVAPSSLAPGLPPELELVILKAMEKDPEDRFKSARFMRKALELVAAGEPTGLKIKGAVRYQERGMSNAAVLGGLLAIGIASVFLIWPELLASLPRVGRTALVALGLAEPRGRGLTAPEGPAGSPEGGTPDPGGVPPGPGTVSRPAGPTGGAPTRDLAELIRRADFVAASRVAAETGAAADAYQAAWIARVRGLLAERALGDAEAGIVGFRNGFPASPWGPFLAGELERARGNGTAAALLFAEGLRKAPRDQVEALFELYQPLLKELDLPARKAFKDKLKEASELSLRVERADDALMLLRMSSRILETPQTHLDLAAVYEKVGAADKVTLHRKRAEALAATGS